MSQQIRCKEKDNRAVIQYSKRHKQGGGAFVEVCSQVQALLLPYTPPPATKKVKTYEAGGTLCGEESRCHCRSLVVTLRRTDLGILKN